MLDKTTTAGSAIAQARQARGWKPEDLIGEVKRQLGKDYVFTPQTLRNIEAGRVRNPGIYTKAAIAHVLKLDVNELWPPRGAQ